MSRTTAIRAFLLGTPLAFAALLAQHPTGGEDLYDLIAADTGVWLALHCAAAVFFPLIALVIWTLIRGLPGRAATVARWALPVYAVFYTVWETIFGIANGLLVASGDDLGGAQREGLRAAVDDIVASPLFGESGAFSAIGSLAWWTAIAGAILALKHAGVRTSALVLLALGGLMTFHIPPIGPPALVCLSIAGYLIERHRAGEPLRMRVLPEA